MGQIQTSHSVYAKLQAESLVKSHKNVCNSKRGEQKYWYKKNAFDSVSPNCTDSRPYFTNAWLNRILTMIRVVMTVQERENYRYCFIGERVFCSTPF